MPDTKEFVRHPDKAVYETDIPVLYEVIDAVAWITMNRPEYNNAQNSQMTYALDAAFRRAVDDDAVGAIVLRGKGRHFSAGHDIGTPGRDVNKSFERAERASARDRGIRTIPRAGKRRRVGALASLAQLSNLMGLRSGDVDASSLQTFEVGQSVYK